MDPVRVLVAEDDPEQRRQLVDALEHRPGIRMVGAAENGVEAVRLIRERLPQVVVCDMVMPRMDGFGVLGAVARMDAGLRPVVVALTALSREAFITQAMEMGAAYYMIKPADVDFLVQLISDLAGRSVSTQPPAAPQEETAEHAVADMLLHIGMPAHLHGYRFLLRSVLLALEKPESLGSVTRGLYPAVALSYHTTASCVERSIRHAINMTWARGGASAFEHVLNRRAFSDNEKPTNCELIALISERMRLQGWGWTRQSAQSNTGS